jgi:hypothetical protein
MKMAHDAAEAGLVSAIYAVGREFLHRLNTVDPDPGFVQDCLGKAKECQDRAEALGHDADIEY